jgi:F-box protein 8
LINFNYIFSRDILERLIELQSYENQFLPNALRQFFTKLDAPEDRNEYLSVLIENFSKRFHECNKDLGLSTGLYISF